MDIQKSSDDIGKNKGWLTESFDSLELDNLKLQYHYKEEVKNKARQRTIDM